MSLSAAVAPRSSRVTASVGFELVHVLNGDNGVVGEGPQKVALVRNGPGSARAPRIVPIAGVHLSRV
jgi:hypothetical protein